MNVALSVVFCVLSVALGHYVASQVNGGEKAIAQTIIEEEA
jgi:CrcB protein